jgi:hypothetical protein
MNEIIQTENLEIYHPERKTRPSVYYKNLYRFTRCFIGGSVAVRLNGKDECAEGAHVTLLRGGKEVVGACVTDDFGDFKIDNLEEKSGTYTLRIDYTGYETKTIEVDLTESLSIGTIFL